MTRPLSNARVVVTGGSGFLGRHVVAEALAAGYEVTTFTRGQTVGSARTGPRPAVSFSRT